MATEWKDLERLFYPIKLSPSSHIQENLKHSRYGAKLAIYKQENLTTRRGDQIVADDTGNNHTNNDNDNQKLSVHDQQILARKKVDESVVDYEKNGKLLCWIMTCSENHIKKAMHVKETWGKRCDILLFMSSVEEPLLPTVKLSVNEDKNHLYPKTRLALQYIFDNYLQEAEWFLKADDDTYVLVENLKHLLNDHNSNDAVYFGNRVINIRDPKSSYFDGGSGYILSREALRTLVTNASHSKLCRVTNTRAEDIKLAYCLNDLGVTFIDTRDKYKRHRFFTSYPHGHIIPKEMGQIAWYMRMNYYPLLKGRECCSEHSITFHHVKANMMYILEYFVYHLRPYGISYKYQ